MALFFAGNKPMWPPENLPKGGRHLTLQCLLFGGGGGKASFIHFAAGGNGKKHTPWWQVFFWTEKGVGYLQLSKSFRLLAPIFRLMAFSFSFMKKHVMHGNSVMQEAQHICLGHVNVRHQQLLMAFMYKFTSRTCSEIFEMQRWRSFLDFFGLSAGTFSNIGRLYRNLAWKKYSPWKNQTSTLYPLMFGLTFLFSFCTWRTPFFFDVEDLCLVEHVLL